jgi:choline kinase
MGGAGPKTLIPIDDDRPLLHFILNGLATAGVDDLLVVTGFGASEIQSYVGEHWSGDATFVFNARWASWGNFHSVRVAIDQSPGYDVMVVNSDVVVNPDVYKRTAETPGDLVLAVQRRPNLDEEDMRVELNGDIVRQVSKSVNKARSHGEYAGVSLLRPEAAAAYAHTATDWEWTAKTAGYYEDVYAAMLDRVDARATFVRVDEYAEVDTPDDVGGAVSVIAANRDAWGASPAPSA